VLRSFVSVAPLLGGLSIVRWVHHVVMWLLLGFMVHHVYSGVLMSTVEANGTMESIFSGYKFVPREDLQYSGYRFINRRGQVDE
jgi:Ni,Fe-hydrogenase I cytochrome b subunit